MYERECPHRGTKQCTSPGAGRGNSSMRNVFIVTDKALILARCGRRMFQFGNFLRKKRVVGKARAQPLQLLASRSGVLVAKIVKSQKNAGKGHEKTATISHQSQLFQALLLIAFESAQAEHPSHRRSLAADNVFS